MTEEEKKEIGEEKKDDKNCECECDCNCNCNCKNSLKTFLLIIFGSFLGCLVALCVFKAAMKPKFPPMPMKAPYQIQQTEHGKFEHHRGMRQEMKGQKFDRKSDKFERRANIPELRGQELDRPPVQKK